MYQIDQEEIKELEMLFKSRKFFRYQGKNVQTHCSLFENEFSHHLGMNYSLFVNSGTNAILLALKALGVGEGDEVIVPSYTFVATVSAVLHAGATPVVASVGQGLTLDPALLEKKITQKTKAIIPVHMDGTPCEMDLIMGIAQKHKLLVIEDVAQAVGGDFKGKKLGSYGVASCFSFNVDKIISCGEGGLVAFKEEAHYKKALMLHDAPVRYGSTHKEYLSDIPLEPGFSMRMSEISAVIMRKQLKRLDGIIKKLRNNKKIFLNDVRGRMVMPPNENGECSTHFHLKCSDPLEASEIAKSLALKGILATPLYTRPAHCFWQWQQLFNYDGKDLGADRVHLSSILKFEIDFDLSDEQLCQKAKTLSEVINA